MESPEGFPHPNNSAEDQNSNEHSLLRERLESCFHARSEINKEERALALVIQEKSQKLKPSLVAMLRHRNAHLLAPETSSNFTRIIEELENLEGSAEFLIKDAEQSEITMSATLQVIETEPQNLKRMEMFGVLKSYEDENNRRGGLWQKPRDLIQNFLKLVEADVENVERLLEVADVEGEMVSLSKEELGKLLQFKPGFENN